MSLDVNACPALQYCTTASNTSVHSANSFSLAAWSFVRRLLRCSNARVIRSAIRSKKQEYVKLMLSGMLLVCQPWRQALKTQAEGEMS